MKKLSGLNYIQESYGVWLYDMSIQDVKERAEKRIKFEKAISAANFLGYIPSKFYEIIGRGKGNYVYHKEKGDKYAVRKIKLNEL